MNALDNAKATAAQLNEAHAADGMTAFVFRVYRMMKKSWVPTGSYWVRCYRAGEKVESVFDGQYVGVPFAG
jgi:hypothetical protein